MGMGLSLMQRAITWVCGESWLAFKRLSSQGWVSGMLSVCTVYIYNVFVSIYVCTNEFGILQFTFFLSHRLVNYTQ